MSYAKYNRVNIVDIECTCYEKGFPENEKQDIIEVGIVQVDIPTRTIGKYGTHLVRPLRSSVSEYCTNLTTITPEMVVKAEIFTDTCHWLKEQYDTKNHPWASYGDFDRSIIHQQCIDMNVRYPFTNDHINMKPITTLMLGKARSMGNFRVSEELGIPFIGTKHRAVDDAMNIAKIFIKFLERMEQ